MNPAQASGVNDGKQQLDLNSAPVLRTRVSAVDRAMTSEAAKAFQRGDINAPGPTQQAIQQAIPSAPVASLLAAQAELENQQMPAPIAQLGPQPAPVTPAAPISDNYPARVNDRINKIWGEKMQAHEYAARLENQMIQLQQKLDSMQSAPQQQQPYTNQYGSSQFQSDSARTPPAGDFISRSEMQAMLSRQSQEMAAQAAIQHAHTVSRLEAEREFPEVFRNETLRSAAERIWNADPFLQRDPKGPLKAAALARAFSEPGSVQAAAAAAADARKAALSAAGPSIAEGTSQQPSREQRYSEALAYAQRSQNVADFVRARNIQLGLA